MFRKLMGELRGDRGGDRGGDQQELLTRPVQELCQVWPLMQSDSPPRFHLGYNTLDQKSMQVAVLPANQVLWRHDPRARHERTVQFDEEMTRAIISSKTKQVFFQRFSMTLSQHLEKGSELLNKFNPDG